MHRLLERLDGAASTLVPLAYLVSLTLGTMAYFSGIVLDFGAAVGISLSFACEVHAFLMQRRTRATWGALSHTARSDDRYEGLAAQFRAQAAILAGLVAFSTYNSVQFVASTWHPTSDFLPAWLQIGIRGCVVPALFLLAGFLAPLTVDAGAVLAQASGDMLHKTVRATVKQWDGRIRRAKARGLNLAPLAVALMQDAGDVDGARRIALIDDGLARAEGAPSPQSARTAAIVAPEEPQASVPPSPPTDGGTPLASSNPSGRIAAPEGRPPVLRLTPPRRSGGNVETTERRVRRVLAQQPDVSIKTLAKLAKCSESSASKYRRVWQLEREHAAAPVARAL